MSIDLSKLNEHLERTRSERDAKTQGYSVEVLDKATGNRQPLRAKRSKRQALVKPFPLYVELLVATDFTVYSDHARYTGSSDPVVIFNHMRYYFAHLINGVRF